MLHSIRSMLQNSPGLIRRVLSAIVISAGLALTACSSDLLTVEHAPLVLAQPEKTPVLPRPNPPVLGSVNWKVLTPETVAKLCAGTPDTKQCTFFFMGMSEDDYQTLALNQAELVRYLNQVDFLLRYYEGKLPPPVAKPPAK